MSAPLTYRLRCRICLQPEFSCYCAHLKPFDPGLTFVILIHPIEAQRRVATGRMSHLSLKGSYLIRGHDYSSSDQVNAIIDNPAHQCFLLYPGPQSTDLSPLGLKERLALFDPTLKPVIFVVDGTWSTARKMVNLSHNLKRLPRIQFTPPTGSRFRVRDHPPFPKPLISSRSEATFMLSSARRTLSEIALRARCAA